MKLVIIFGPQAVGKMTVGHELEKITGLKLFHNHMTIDLVAPFFDYGSTEGRQLVNHFRESIFQAVAASNLEGLIFTYVWAFDDKSDWDYMEHVSKIFQEKGGSIYYVELEAPLDHRIERNKSEHRLLHKPMKRNIEKSEHDLKSTQQRLNSRPGEITYTNYLRIDNTDIDPAAAAMIIKDKFKL